MTSIRYFTGLAVLAALAGCAGAPKYNPFVVPADTWRSGVRVVALTPIGVGLRDFDENRVRTVFDAPLQAALRSYGFEIIDPVKVGAFLDHLTDSAGGVYDPISGQPDTSKLAALRQIALEHLRNTYHVDALLYPNVIVVPAQWNDNKAKWDGADQSIQSTGSLILQYLGGISARGTLPALSLDIQMEDMSGRTLFSNRGGIHVLSRRSGRGFEDISPFEAIADTMRNSQAIQIALGPLAPVTPK